MDVITTEGVPPRERFDFWRETVGRNALQFRMEPVKHTPQVEARFVAVGGLSIMRFAGSVASRYTRTRAEISRSEAPCYYVPIQLRDQCLIDSGKGMSVLGAGDGFVADPLRDYDMRYVAPENPHKRALVVGFRKEVVTAR